MRKLLRLYNRCRIEGIYCAFCDMKRDGMVLFEDMYVKKILDCGHKVGRSFRLPPSELVRLGYMNKDNGSRDPRALAAINVAIEDAKRTWEQGKRKRWQDENLTSGRRYL